MKDSENSIFSNPSWGVCWWSRDIQTIAIQYEIEMKLIDRIALKVDEKRLSDLR